MRKQTTVRSFLPERLLLTFTTCLHEYVGGSAVSLFHSPDPERVLLMLGKPEQKGSRRKNAETDSPVGKNALHLFAGKRQDGRGWRGLGWGGVVLACDNCGRSRNYKSPSLKTRKKKLPFYTVKHKKNKPNKTGVFKVMTLCIRFPAARQSKPPPPVIKCNFCKIQDALASACISNPPDWYNQPARQAGSRRRCAEKLVMSPEFLLIVSSDAMKVTAHVSGCCFLFGFSDHIRVSESRGIEGLNDENSA